MLFIQLVVEGYDTTVIQIEGYAGTGIVLYILPKAFGIFIRIYPFNDNDGVLRHGIKDSIRKRTVITGYCHSY